MKFNFGKYQNQVFIEIKDANKPLYAKDGKIKRIMCDYEIASEIAFLNLLGIKTIESCAGHGDSVASVLVYPKYDAIMKKLGYELTSEQIDGFSSYKLHPVPYWDIAKRLNEDADIKEVK